MNNSESINRYFNFDKRLFFFILCLAIFGNNYFMREFIVTKDVFYRSFGEQVAIERIDRYLDMREKIKWIVFGFIPIILLIKMSLVSLCINVGTEAMDYQIGFKKIFKVVLIAESVFVFATLLRTFLLYAYVDVSVMDDVQHFYPLSLANAFNLNNFPTWLSYPFLTANLFELIYIFVLSYGFSQVLQNKFSESFKLVALSYGIGLLIWTVFIVFLSINFS